MGCRGIEEDENGIEGRTGGDGIGMRKDTDRAEWDGEGRCVSSIDLAGGETRLGMPSGGRDRGKDDRLLLGDVPK